MFVGHKLILENFKELVRAERLAHGYVFFGPEGVGKKTFALAFANFLETGNFGSDNGKILNDTLLIQPDEKGTIGIDAVRGIKNFLYRRPNVSLRRTLVVDEVEALTGEAQNALLKITEEPPESSLLILVARDPEILIPTIQSRLQKIYFAPLRLEEVEGGLLSLGVKCPSSAEAPAVAKAMAGESAGKQVSSAKKAAEKSRGSLGLAVKMLSSDGWNEMREQAERFLEISGPAKREFIKKLLEPESFDLGAFLDMVALVLASKKKIDYNLWHKVLELRRNFSNFPLNPRLQLESLLNSYVR